MDMQAVRLSLPDRVRYFSQRAAWFAAGAAFGSVVGRATGVKPVAPSRATVLALRDRLVKLVKSDLRNVELGHYPRELLSTSLSKQIVRALPMLARDAPLFAARKRHGNFKDLPAHLALEEFPPYYRRNFHWQSDGYLSDASAAVYEASVELLFRGTADVMRRQVIPHLSRMQSDGEPFHRLLDLGAGTGGMLAMFARCFGELHLEGIELSPFYANEANRRLGARAHVSAGNAETLSAAQSSYDAVTSVFLFHELPRRARRNVLREAFRVLRPGGLLVIEDSSQYSDAPELRDVLDGFPREFHEPYYLDYLTDPLPELVREAGFVVEAHESHMVATVVAARKPRYAA
jgi:ubiquinone/menaquinone biosynthesis C-methylase UbiE